MKRETWNMRRLRLPLFPSQTDVKFTASLKRGRSESPWKRKNRRERRNHRCAIDLRLAARRRRCPLDLLRINSFPKSRVGSRPVVVPLPNDLPASQQVRRPAEPDKRRHTECGWYLGG